MSGSHLSLQRIKGRGRTPARKRVVSDNVGGCLGGGGVMAVQLNELTHHQTLDGPEAICGWSHSLIFSSWVQGVR